ncbi:MAG: hypothetical protein F4Y99_00165 [Acidimicrobiaceae bacterium]|nr:hypothetical protein [Acidimicrobiaceae bacterium]MCY3650712.1 hypothetical protein [Acidimicrobiaceae bacterium]MDE0516200.1 hypothetical protein [Acidimicrobiaceae bacterium]MDE0655791.1 hypothetical protein [Acidimicrobiaceae bacterium]MXZ94331.1 hypothetical protein [Acidimicrobiaceae bacterium]
MTVPVLVLMLAAMVTAMTASLRDYAAHAAASDLAEIRAEHAAAAFVASCITHEGCAPPETEGIEACAVADSGIVVSAQVAWTPVLWKGLMPATADRAVAYDEGVGAGIKTRAVAALDPC